MFRFASFAALLIFCALTNLHCQQEPMPVDTNEPPPASVTILALGDSYTKGESVPSNKNFPNQLADSLQTVGYKVDGLRIIAQTGWRTDQLQQAISAATDISDSVFSLVTLCIGVNNQYQNGNIEVYKTQFESLLKTALDRAGGIKKKVVVLSIPDWAYTPYGQNFPGGPNAISQKIDLFNAAQRSITESYGITFIDVTPTSRKGLEDTELVATDGLHPSAKQYTAWVSLLLPAAQVALNP